MLTWYGWRHIPARDILCWGVEVTYRYVFRTLSNICDWAKRYERLASHICWDGAFYAKVVTFFSQETASQILHTSYIYFVEQTKTFECYVDKFGKNSPKIIHSLLVPAQDMRSPWFQGWSICHKYLFFCFYDLFIINFSLYCFSVFTFTFLIMLSLLLLLKR